MHKHCDAGASTSRHPPPRFAIRFSTVESRSCRPTTPTCKHASAPPHHDSPTHSRNTARERLRGRPVVRETTSSRKATSCVETDERRKIKLILISLHHVFDAKDEREKKSAELFKKRAAPPGFAHVSRRRILRAPWPSFGGHDLLCSRQRSALISDSCHLPRTRSFRVSRPSQAAARRAPSRRTLQTTSSPRLRVGTTSHPSVRSTAAVAGHARKNLELAPCKARIALSFGYVSFACRSRF